MKKRRLFNTYIVKNLQENKELEDLKKSKDDIPVVDNIFKHVEPVCNYPDTLFSAEQLQEITKSVDCHIVALHNKLTTIKVEQSDYI